MNGGETEIRTPGSDEATQPFQGCTIDHSDTSPWKDYTKQIYKRLHLTQLMTRLVKFGILEIRNYP
jgi:hypothetical protein